MHVFTWNKCTYVGEWLEKMLDIGIQFLLNIYSKGFKSQTPLLYTQLYFHCLQNMQIIPHTLRSMWAVTMFMSHSHHNKQDPKRALYIEYFQILLIKWVNNLNEGIKIICNWKWNWAWRVRNILYHLE